MKAKKILFIAALVILLAVFTVSAVYIISYFAEGAKQQAQYDELAGIVESIQQATAETDGSTENTHTENSDTEESTEATRPEGEILPEYAPLYEMNGDLVGWLRIDGTNVNYPVMQTPNSPDFYLYKNFSKEYSARGCLYVRESCDVVTPSDNVTIYGHNMNDGTMFHDLRYYDDPAYFEAHPIIVFDTLTERHTYQIFAVFKTTATVGKGFEYHKFENAATKAEFNAFVAQCKNLAFYNTGFAPQYGDKIICLSTCEYTLENGRLVVAAYRIS